MYESIYKGKQECLICGGEHSIVNITDHTVIKDLAIIIIFLKRLVVRGKMMRGIAFNRNGKILWINRTFI